MNSKMFTKLAIMLVVATVAFLNIFGSCEAEGSVSVSWEFSMDASLPECAPDDAEAFRVRIANFKVAYDPILADYEAALDELKTILSLEASATAQDVIDTITEGISSETSCKFELKAELTIDLSAEANINNNEAEMNASAEFKAKFEMEWVCDSSITLNAPFDDPTVITEVAAQAEVFKRIATLAIGLQAKNDTFTADVIASIGESITAIGDCPALLLALPDITTAYTDAIEEASDIWLGTETKVGLFAIVSDTDSIVAAIENQPATE